MKIYSGVIANLNLKYNKIINYVYIYIYYNKRKLAIIQVMFVVYKVASLMIENMLTINFRFQINRQYDRDPN